VRISTKPRRQNSHRADATKRCAPFLQWLRGRECAAERFGEIECDGRLEAAHVDYAGDKGMSTKCSDRYTIPLCSAHHRRQHSIGWKSFERETWGHNREGHALGLANSYWHYWPGRIAWERKLNDGR